VAKSKLRGSWGDKVEAQGGLGVAKPNLTRSISGPSGGFWAGLGGSRGVRRVQGRAQRKL